MSCKIIKRCASIMTLCTFTTCTLFAHEASSLANIPSVHATSLVDQDALIAGLPPVIPRREAAPERDPQEQSANDASKNQIETASNNKESSEGEGNDSAIGGYEFKSGPPPITASEAKTNRFLQGAFVLLTALLFTIGFIATKVSPGESVKFGEDPFADRK